MHARIFLPAKTAMQSGRRNTRRWILEFEPEAAKRIDPLMGWTGSADQNGQVRLSFATREEAEDYAARYHIPFQAAAPHERRLVIKAYADNFKFDRVV